MTTDNGKVAIDPSTRLDDPERVRRLGRTPRRVLNAVLLSALLALSAAAVAAADPRTEIADEVSFLDVDPCTGAVHEVTISVNLLVHFHDRVTAARGVRTLSTSSGYVGRGTSSFVENGRVEMFRFTDLLADEPGNRIRAREVLVIDPSTGTFRVRELELKCLGRSS
jgi:hypothetical protein